MYIYSLKKMRDFRGEEEKKDGEVKIKEFSRKDEGPFLLQFEVLRCILVQHTGWL